MNHDEIKELVIKRATTPQSRGCIVGTEKILNLIYNGKVYISFSSFRRDIERDLKVPPYSIVYPIIDFTLDQFVDHLFELSCLSV